MALSSDQIKLVQDTFALVAPQADKAAQIFYARLFELDPSLRPLFKHDLREQGRKLMQMLSIAVHALDNIESLLPALKALGDRHAGYGAQIEDYETVGAALLWTLEQGLGAAFTPEVSEAWATTYAALVEAATAHLFYQEPA
jgi:hemoglobin-like flavoprotein